MMRWDPFNDPAINKMSWFLELLTYGMDKNTQLDPGDDDSSVVPSLVEKVVLPRGVKLLTHIWNPRSVKQTEKAKALVKEFLVYFDAQSEVMKVPSKLLFDRPFKGDLQRNHREHSGRRGNPPSFHRL